MNLNLCAYMVGFCRDSHNYNLNIRRLEACLHNENNAHQGIIIHLLFDLPTQNSLNTYIYIYIYIYI